MTSPDIQTATADVGVGTGDLLGNHPPVCVECAHFLRGHGMRGGACMRRSGKVRDLVDGEVMIRGILDARDERFLADTLKQQGHDPCGREGKHFLKKLPKVPPAKVSLWRRLLRFPNV